jgi:tetratricopeptide (TPR) repeat protein
MDQAIFKQRLAEADRLDQAGDAVEAERILTEIVTAAPDAVGAFRRRGMLRARRFDYPAARDDLETAASLAPDDAPTILSLARLYDRIGIARLADVSVRRALELRPGYPGAITLLGRIARPGKDETGILPEIEAALARPDLPSGDRSTIGFAAGRVLHLANRHSEAFSHFEAANKAKNAKDNASGRESLAQDLMSVFKRIDWPTHPTRARLILLVGLPYSGAAFLADTLASHPGAVLVDDPGALANTAASLNAYGGLEAKFPACVPQLSKEAWETAAAAFRGRLYENWGPADTYMMAPPAGFLQVGLAAALMPEAVIVDVRRPPMASALATYMWNPSAGAHYSFSFESLGRLYRLYEQAMAFWSAWLPRPPIRIDAEAMVRLPQTSASTILAQAGMEFDPDCQHYIESVPETERFGDDVGLDGWQAYAPHLQGLSGHLWPLPQGARQDD